MLGMSLDGSMLTLKLRRIVRERNDMRWEMSYAFYEERAMGDKPKTDMGS